MLLSVLSDDVFAPCIHAIVYVFASFANFNIECNDERLVIISVYVLNVS